MVKQIAQVKWSSYLRLMRIDKPIGTLLLLWPTLWALWLANSAIPKLHLLIVFILGVILMRAAGCVINDYADRHFDGAVERTCHRPFPQGEVSEREGKALFILLIICAFLLVLTLNWMTIGLSIIAVLLAASYPFMKRITYLPQVVLGVAFGWSIPMAFAASNETLPLSCWLLLLANILWTVVYDTEYAMVDQNDDVKIGIKSTAILFGDYNKIIIGFLQVIMLLVLLLVGYINQLNIIYYLTVFITLLFFIYQQKLLLTKDRKYYFTAFLNNNYVGLILFIGIASNFIHY